MPAGPHPEVSHQLDDFTSSFNRIRLRGDTLIRLSDALGLITASPHKLRKIMGTFYPILKEAKGPYQFNDGRGR